MDLILLRHVESKSNKEDKADSQMDSELTEKGKKEAKELISKLERIVNRCCYCQSIKKNTGYY